MSIEGYKLGALGTNTLSGTMYAVSYVASAGQWETLESPVGVDYQVTAGYTLYISKIIWFCGGAGNQIAEFGYADNAVAEGSNALTNGVVVVPNLTGAADTKQTLEGLWTIPAEKYPYMKSTGNAASIFIFGKEVAN